MTVALTKVETQIVWRSPDAGDKAVSIPGSVPGNKGYDLDIATTLADGSTYVVTPTSGTIDGQPSFTFTEPPNEHCNLSLRSDADNADWIIRSLCCVALPDICGPLATSSGGTWDPSSGHGGLQTYSAGNTVVNPHNTLGLFSGFPSAVWRSTTSHISGRYWFEVHAGVGTTVPLIAQLVGLANDSFPDTGTGSQVGGTRDGVGLGAPFVNTQGVWINGGKLVSWPPFVGTRSFQVAVNLDIMRIWAMTQPGIYNFSSTANPTMNIGGWDISSLNAGPYRITMSQIVQWPVLYPPITIVTKDNIAAALTSGPQCYVPW